LTKPILKMLMNIVDRNLVESYSTLLEGLSASNKLELIERLSNSLAIEQTEREEAFYKSFGAFASDQSAEEIIQEIKSSRQFRKREIEF